MDSRQMIIVEKDSKRRAVLRHSLMKKTNAYLGICEQLRFIYDDVDTMRPGEKKDRMTERLIDALGMAKKMDDRLNYYFKTYADKTGHNAKNIIVLQNNHGRIRMRWERKI